MNHQQFVTNPNFMHPTFVWGKSPSNSPSNTTAAQVSSDPPDPMYPRKITCHSPYIAHPATAIPLATPIMKGILAYSLLVKVAVRVCSKGVVKQPWNLVSTPCCSRPSPSSRFGKKVKKRRGGGSNQKHKFTNGVMGPR